MVCMIVEDDPVACQVLATMVRRCGLEVRSAASMGCARRLLTGTRVQVVITDLRLPDGLGHELAAAVDAPVVLLSGAVTPQIEQAAADAGCAAVLTKPVRMAALRDLLADLLPGR